MEIKIIEPKSEYSGYNFSHMNKLPMLGSIYLGTILNDAGHNVKVYNEKLVMPKNLDADVLILNSLTSGANRAYSLAEQFKQQNPEGKVLMGGYHASFMPEEALQHVDQVAIGEGENIILDLVNGKIKDRIVHGTPIDDLNKLPFPDYSLMKGLNYPKKRLNWLPMATSRGCPFDCTFCSVTQMFGRSYRAKSPDRVMEELARNRYKYIFFYDDNFTADKNRTIDILQSMKNNGITKRWVTQTRIDIANNEQMLKLMSDTKCDMVFLGLESVNEQTLKDYKKAQGLQQMKEAIKKIRDYGIQVWGGFVMGSDQDDKKTMQKTVDFCNETGIEVPQFSILTPFPGTKLFNDLVEQGRLITKNWSLFDGWHVVFKPKKLSAYELQEHTIDAFRQVWKNGKRLFRQITPALRDIQNLKVAIDGLNVMKQVKKENKRYLEFLTKVN
ncbi:B12-binding domain-containing radical SAM protein [Candidatus Woesearchaeota archaeon]|nr:B12-binding domain-containing radical SAM protein [Candidatus Woesearchaeota archaeon]MBW3017638.1 B12-binding domain-containing radical SAM protein [Candidatus Woesearchaeota archaeon]